MQNNKKWFLDINKDKNKKKLRDRSYCDLLNLLDYMIDNWNTKEYTFITRSIEKYDMLKKFWKKYIEISHYKIWKNMDIHLVRKVVLFAISNEITYQKAKQETWINYDQWINFHSMWNGMKKDNKDLLLEYLWL